MFHSEEGLYFTRATADGAVRIVKTVDGRPPEQDNVILDQTIAAGSWCSIVCAVSEKGERDMRWFKACEFHGQPEDEGI